MNGTEHIRDWLGPNETILNAVQDIRWKNESWHYAANFPGDESSPYEPGDIILTNHRLILIELDRFDANKKKTKVVFCNRYRKLGRETSTI